MTSKATRRRHWLRRVVPRGPRLHRQHQKHIPHHIEGEVGDVELAAGDVDLRELVDERACHTEEDRPPRRMPRDPCAEEKPCAQPECPASIARPFTSWLIAFVTLTIRFVSAAESGPGCSDSVAIRSITPSSRMSDHSFSFFTCLLPSMPKPSLGGPMPTSACCTHLNLISKHVRVLITKGAADRRSAHYKFFTEPSRSELCQGSSANFSTEGSVIG